MDNYITVSTADITLPAYNSKLDEPHKYERLLAVIKKRGQTLPIQVREIDHGYEVITGRKVLRCLKKLGIEKVIVYTHGVITDQEARLIHLETDLQNYETDAVGLAEIITDLTKWYGVEELLNTLPFTVNQINGYIELLVFDWESLQQPSGKKLTKNSVVRPPTEPTGIALQQQLLSIYGVGNIINPKL